MPPRRRSGRRCIALSGDDAACAEMTGWDPAATTIAVKRARDRFAAELRPVAEARDAIEEAVTGAVRGGRDAGRRPSRIRRALAIRWQSASVASQLAGVPGVTLRDSRTTAVTGAMPDLFRLLGVFFSVAATLTSQPPYC